MKLKLDPAVWHVLRNPAFQLSAAAGAGLLVLGLAGFLWAAPEQSRLNGIEQELANAVQRKSTVAQAPIPKRATKEDVAALLEQVPVREDAARLVKLFQSTAEESKVELTSIQWGQVAADAGSKLEETITKAAQASLQAGGTLSVGNEASASPAAPTPVPTEQEQKDKEKQIFQETELEVTVGGSYRQVMDFLDKIQNQTRVLKIKNWILGAESESGDGSSDSAESRIPAASADPSGGMPVTLKLKVAAYVAAQYAGKAGDLPPLPSAAGSNREDPTYTEEQLWQLLQSGGAADQP